MAAAEPNKFYPAASDEIANMLGLKGPGLSVAPESAKVAESVVVNSEQVGQEGPSITEEHIHADVAAITGKDSNLVGFSTPEQTIVNVKSSAGGRAIRRTLLAVLPYVVVFAVGLFVYNTWFSDPSNRPQIFKGLQRAAKDPAAVRSAAYEALEKDNQAEFAAWISQFYFSVSDPTVVAMDTVAVNKLTNFENYLLKLNPRVNDIRNTGVSDADAVLAGQDPVTGESLADWQRDIVAQYFDAGAIKERVPGPSVSAKRILLPRGPAVSAAQIAQVAGAVIAQVAASPAAAQESLNTPPSVAPSQPSPAQTPATSTPSCSENKLKINTNIPGRLEVPSMGVNVPIIWTKDAKNFDTDLKTGVVHYPCTPLPGDIGTSYVSGHSSNYSWVKASYNQVFAKMNSLADGATFKVTVVGPDGKDIRLYYIVQRKQIYAADDQAQFVNTADSVVALSTCWPINTTQKRMVAFGKLDRVER